MDLRAWRSLLVRCFSRGPVGTVFYYPFPW